jgi:hypothetical protein
MRSHLTRSAFVALALGLVAAGHAQGAAAPGADVSGDWSFRFVGDRGAMVMHLAGQQFGVFDVHGAGYTKLFPQQAFAISDAPTQQLAFDSKGHIHGVVALTDVTRTSALGTLTITTGTLNSTATHVNLLGTIVLGDATEKKVRLYASRLVAPTVSLTGRAFDGVLLGKNASSTKYDVQVYDASEAPSGSPATPDEAYPFFVLRAGGAASIDGAEVSASRIDGLLVADYRGMVFGRVVSSDFGPCVLRGNFVTNDPSTLGLPMLVCTLVADSGRRVRLTAVLGPFSAQ